MSVTWIRNIAPVLLLSPWLATNALAQSAQTDASPNSGLTEEELLLEPPMQQPLAEFDEKPPVPVSKASEILLTPIARGGYSDRQGRLVVDIIETDNAFLAVQVETPDGNPVIGAKATTSLAGTSVIVDTSDGLLTTSDRYGIMELAVLGGQMGIDVLTVEINDETVEIVLNVLSLEAAGVPELPELKDGIAWDELMRANVTYQGNEIAAEFPAEIAQRAGETVRIAGFMTPLQADSSQRWFLLTSNPPHCYFDIPGGPAGAIEVLAPDGVEISWEPIIVEGRFEPVARGDGAVYRLHEAKRVQP